MLLTVLIPSYNRANMIVRSVTSALHFVDMCSTLADVVVVDDASTDGTVELLRREFSGALMAERLKIVRLEQNVGVTAARMAGLSQALGKWILIYDSDDQFVEDARLVRNYVELLRERNEPMVFTRCRSVSTGQVIGPALRVPQLLTLRQFIGEGTPGECMTAIRRDVLEAIPYDVTIRAFEGLTMARQMKRFGAAFISPLCIRIYNDTAQADRLSNFVERRRRADDLARGFLAFLREFWREMGWKTRMAYAARYLFYRALSWMPKK